MLCLTGCMHQVSDGGDDVLTWCSMSAIVVIFDRLNDVSDRGMMEMMEMHWVC
jgi:hypothetical protein